VRQCCVTFKQHKRERKRGGKQCSFRLVVCPPNLSPTRMHGKTAEIVDRIASSQTHTHTHTHTHTKRPRSSKHEQGHKQQLFCLFFPLCCCLYKHGKRNTRIKKTLCGKHVPPPQRRRRHSSSTTRTTVPRGVPGTITPTEQTPRHLR
jgi:hypothetical protein